jgi:hypothetical protein
MGAASPKFCQEVLPVVFAGAIGLVFGPLAARLPGAQFNTQSPQVPAPGMR